MPQYNEFWNPYRLSPRRPGQLPRRKPQGHHLFNGWLGTIDCELEALEQSRYWPRTVYSQTECQ